MDRVAGGVTIYGKYTESREHSEQRASSQEQRETLYYIDGLIQTNT
jgi:hypothetical protein